MPTHVFSYEVKPGKRLPGIEPHVDNSSVITMYGNFDIILDHFSRISQLCTTRHTS